MSEVSVENPTQPIGEITMFSADKLEASLKSERSARLPKGTVANFRVGVRANEYAIHYHNVSKAVVGEEVTAVPVRSTNVGVELPEVGTVEFKPVSETYLEVSRLREGKQAQLDKLVEDEMKSRGLDPYDIHERFDIEDYVSERNPVLVSEISSLNQTQSLEGAKSAKQALTTTKIEKPLSDLNINPEDVVDAGFVVATDRMVEI